MFYTRINKLKIFNNKEGFLGLFNRAEMRIYSHVIGNEPAGAPLTLSDLAGLPDEAARQEKLMEAVLAGGKELAQGNLLAVDNVKDNQSLLFGESGLVIYRDEVIPDHLNIRLWVIESDEDARRVALDADEVIESDAFKGLLAAVTAGLAAASPALAGAIAVGGVVANLLRRKLRANKDDLVGYWQCALNRPEHYPHGVRDRQDIPDTTGNIRVDYTLFGYENAV
ncbi:MAG: hypothetical protein LBP56_08295 [Odoribacteraceae bacterium]|jgi:hypothetical protein|nr:hypothetical protein [Odoribacteraceae bacterium]